ncbi:DUF6884 domain-containing protein [Streptomyces malaysiensis]|nr:DUF6884 domain-containing protein [Streptomyces malaysiensis]
MTEIFKKLPTRQHEAVLHAAQRPDHLVPGIDDWQAVTFNERTLAAVHRAGFADIRPASYDKRPMTYEETGRTLFLTPTGRAYATQFGVPCQRRQVVVIQCGKKKAEPSWEKYGSRGVIKAGQLYIGHYHRSLRLAATALTSPIVTWIMSAKFGLVSLKRPLPPYDVELGDEGSITSEEMHGDAASLDLADADVIFLGSQKYANFFIESVPHAYTPLTGDLLAQRSQCKAVREKPSLARASWKIATGKFDEYAKRAQ